jgi:hypothetical protein
MTKETTTTKAEDGDTAFCSDQLQQEKRKRVTPQWREAVAGASAAAFSRTVMAPIERVKLMKQLQGSVTMKVSAGTTTSPKNALELSAWQVRHLVYQEHGLASFWRGNIPNVMRVSGTAPIIVTCMD